MKQNLGQGGDRVFVVESTFVVVVVFVVAPFSKREY